MEQGFPGQHTTTTTMTASTTTVQPNIRFDPSYLRTLPGILKAVQLEAVANGVPQPICNQRRWSITNLLGFICITVSHFSSHSRGGWFNTVAMGGFWFTGILLALYLFHVIEKFFKIPWLKIEFIFCAIWTVFYLIAASLAADYGRVSESFGVAAFFGFSAMVVYGYDAWLKFSGVKSGALAQGERQVTKQVSTVTSPAY